MKEILKVIATPFVALWKWIKETAWVQPLLIVGVIFGVIFSIPTITTWINDIIDYFDDGLDYYENINLSLSKAYKGKSECDDFFVAYEKAQGYLNGDEDFSEQDYTAFKNKYGEKFFLVFAQSECDACEEISDALEELKDNWKKYILTEDGTTTEKYKCWSIICNEDLSDSEEKKYTDFKPFEYILNDHSQFFEDMQKFGKINTYYNNLTSAEQSVQAGYIENFMGDISSIHTPCVVLFDLTGKESSNGADWNYLANTVFFSIPSSSSTNDVTRAQFLAQAWYGKKDFQIED